MKPCTVEHLIFTR